MVIDPDAAPSGSNGRLKSPQYAGTSPQACRSTVPIRLIGVAAAGPQAIPAASRAVKTSLAPGIVWFFVLLVRLRNDPVAVLDQRGPGRICEMHDVPALRS